MNECMIEADMGPKLWVTFLSIDSFSARLRRS